MSSAFARRYVLESGGESSFFSVDWRLYARRKGAFRISGVTRENGWFDATRRSSDLYFCSLPRVVRTLCGDFSIS
jgi:hypothetical protein